MITKEEIDKLNTKTITAIEKTMSSDLDVQSKIDVIASYVKYHKKSRREDIEMVSRFDV